MRDLLEESRNRLMVLIALEALRRGFRVGKKTTCVAGWEREWFNCCYIDTPQGLVSWHYRDCFADLFEGLPPYEPLLINGGERMTAS